MAKLRLCGQPQGYPNSSRRQLALPRGQPGPPQEGGAWGARRPAPEPGLQRRPRAETESAPYKYSASRPGRSGAGAGSWRGTSLPPRRWRWRRRTRRRRRWWRARGAPLRCLLRLPAWICLREFSEKGTTDTLPQCRQESDFHRRRGCHPGC